MILLVSYFSYHSYLSYLVSDFSLACVSVTAPVTASCRLRFEMTREAGQYDPQHHRYLYSVSSKRMVHHQEMIHNPRSPRGLSICLFITRHGVHVSTP